MATYVLDGKASASLPRRPLAITLSTTGTDTSDGVRLSAQNRAGEPVRAVATSPRLMILPRVDDEIVVVAVPDGGRTQFDQGTVLHVTFGPDATDDHAADIAQLSPRDVSGLSFIELATVAPGPGDTLQIKTRLALPDAALPPLAAMARVASRGVLRTDRISETAVVNMRCVVDTSASMLGLFESGAVAACADVVAGIGAVVSEGPTVSLVMAGGGAGATSIVEGAALGESLTTAPTGGYGLAPDLGTIAAPSGRTLTVVITDGPGMVPSGSADTISLVLSNSPALVRRAEFVGSVCPIPDAGVDVRQQLSLNPQLVGSIVSELLTAAGLVGEP